jgi:hypothetical protein
LSNQPIMRNSNNTIDESPPKKSLSPGVKRALIALVSFLLMTTVLDVFIWISTTLLQDVEERNRWIVAPSMFFLTGVTLISYSIFAIFNVGLNLVLSRKSGSIAVIHLFMIGMVISFSFFVFSQWDKEKWGCAEKKTSFVCWIENSVTTIDAYINGYTAYVFRLIENIL